MSTQLIAPTTLTTGYVWFGEEYALYNATLTLSNTSNMPWSYEIVTSQNGVVTPVASTPLTSYASGTQTVALSAVAGRIGVRFNNPNGVTLSAAITVTSEDPSSAPTTNPIATTTQLWVDCNRTDDYTETGSISNPYQTLGAALAAVTGPTQISMAPGSYTESIANYPAYPLTVYGNGSTLTLGVATHLTLDYTGYDLNVIAPAGITYAGVAATTRFILRNGSRKGPMALTKGFLDLQACTQTWNTTSDKITVSGTGNLLEIGCINTLPVLQTSATSVVFIENCNWNTSRASTYLLESSAGQFSVANTIVANGSATAGGGIYIHNAQTTSLPNIISGCFVSAVNAINVASGITLYSKVASSGTVVAATIVAVPDVKQYTTEPFTPISAGFTVSAATPDNLFLASSYAINLGTALVAKYIAISSTASYTIVVPSTVTVYYNGVTYTNVTKTVPSGYTMCLNQISATMWFLQGSATLS
jgi:hypothetical protein